MPATRADVARLAGVSPSTVTYVLTGKRATSERTRERVLRAVQQLGYHPNSHASVLAARSVRSVGVLFRMQPRAIDVDDSGYVGGLRARLETEGIRVFTPLVRARDTREDLRALVHSRALDAAVLMDVTPGDERERFLRDEVPVVLIGTSGAGKSPLVSLLVRAQDPTAGRVSLDGHPLCELDLDELRAAAAGRGLAALASEQGGRIIVIIGGEQLTGTDAALRAAHELEALFASGTVIVGPLVTTPGPRPRASSPRSSCSRSGPWPAIRSRAAGSWTTSTGRWPPPAVSCSQRPSASSTTGAPSSPRRGPCSCTPTRCATACTRSRSSPR